MASMSKRTQARNERELHELLRLPGNSQCADCGAKNPAWASWNLGVFLCMRCASLHRKLGTHISKVKSLSMDTWTADQVESMKRNGNIAVNKVYNPKNKKPDMPLDIDEVDSAMERFIRKKYQEKSLSDGKPEPPQRDEISPATYSRQEEQESPPPPLPPKKGRFFGFGLRASSSAYTLSKHDKKKLPKEPRVDSAFPISTDDYDSMSRMADARFDMTEAELQQKLNALRDMGFTDTGRNTSLLRRLGGNVERTIERLVQEGQRDTTTSSAGRRPNPTTNADSSRDSTAASAPATRAPASSEPSYNPFTHMTGEQTVGLSISKPQQPANSPAQVYHSTNPFGPATHTQTETGLEQSLQSMQLAHPLFPHSTGGYPSQPPPLQDPRLQYSVTPPVPSTHFQQGYVASPAAISMNTNPFFQSTSGPPQSTSNNPFLPQTAPASGPVSSSTHPLVSYQSVQAGPPAPPQQRQSSLPITLTSNPFGLPPGPASSQTIQERTAPQFQMQDPFGPVRQNPFETQQTHNPFLTQQMQPQQQQVAPSQSPQPPASGPGFPSFQYGQAQTQPQPQQQNPQFQQQAMFQQQFNQQPQTLSPQHTGRYDKNTILALYNYPQFAPKPLASIPEPGPETVGSAQPSSQQHTSPMQSGDVHFQPNPISPAKRSATMPASISNMHSAGGVGSRNPFLTNTASTTANFNLSANPSSPGFAGGSGTSPARAQGGAARHHASADSVSISNLESGRHSPDAFASLSARSVR
ncbi:hypothetical protein A1O3_07687 [Capronia epimyces CBS 606.96]|uniref:Arf-GAP domain-containing protein n=1 Tax=Capronia epimyces CBS 606.96 TaxID=1182542 RepID=W9XWP8_9EURO|nr:uncharacterized protein A1O3_07687 [Capronia epimyces CBS 606.96]EXJ81396.1 hypothetical protein A1O3_07687 [Capronia epimyces CBS 606.96]